MSRSIRLPAVLSGIVAASLLLPGRADDKATPGFAMTAEEKELLERTNKARAKEKLPPLKPHPLLFKAARNHSANMARQEKMEHVLDGKDPSDRVKEAGYRRGWIGENVAAGYEWGLDAVFKTWMDSRPHRENIHSKRYTEIGIGLAKSAKGEVYYTQVFASPAK